MVDFFAKEQTISKIFQIDAFNDNWDNLAVSDQIQIPPLALSQEDLQKKFTRHISLGYMGIKFFPGMKDNNTATWQQNSVLLLEEQAPDAIYVLSDMGTANIVLNNQYRCCLGILRRNDVSKSYNQTSGDNYKTILYDLTEKFDVVIKNNQNMIDVTLACYNLKTRNFDPIINNLTPFGKIINTQSQTITSCTFKLRQSDITDSQNLYTGNVNPIHYSLFIKISVPFEEM